MATREKNGYSTIQWPSTEIKITITGFITTPDSYPYCYSYRHPHRRAPRAPFPKG